MVKESFGKLSDGTEIFIYTLTNVHGSEIKITNYGATLVSVKVLDKDGNFEHVILGFGNIEDYEKIRAYYGVIAGRYANRIGKAKFSLDGEEFQLDKNDGENMLHGGLKGFDRVVWNAKEIMGDIPGVELTYLSADGEGGFPGNLTTKATYTFSDDNEFVSNYLSLRQNSQRFDPAAGQVIDNFRGTKALNKFDIFAKAWQLRKVWKLDPVLMREVNRYCGPIDWNDPNTHLPLDWRHPDSHAIYWAIKGLKILAEEEDREIDATETNADRIVFHSLQDLFRNGTIFIYELQLPPSPDSPEQPQERILKEVFLRPDLRMFEPYNTSVLTTLEKYKEAGDEQRNVSLENGHRNMLKNAVNSFYYAGHKPQAQKIYTQLRKLYPLEEFKNPIVDEYVKERFKEELDAIGINDAKEMITMMLRDSYYLYAIRDDDGSFNSEKMAEQVWHYYQVKHDDPEFRINLPSLQQFRSFALRDFLNDRLFPPYLRQTLLGRIRIEKPELFKKLEAEAEKLRKQSEQAK